jgi:glycosyltransferase involved in cell wall biosynthesis
MAANAGGAPIVSVITSKAPLTPAAIEKLAWFLDTHPEYDCARGYSQADNPGPLMVRKEQRGSHLGVNKCGVIPEFLDKPAVQARSGSRRLLLLAPFLEIGGADKFNLDLIERLQQDHSYQVSVITTLSSPNRWRERFERLTPDVFTLHTFLPVEDYARFISYWIENWKPDTVLIAGSRAGYQLLPVLRTAGGPSFVDYLHIEDPDPRGYPQLSLQYASFLDGTIVSSEYLRARQVEAGGDPKRIHVATTNIDPQIWDRSRVQKVPQSVPVIAYIARLTKQKQPRVMAAALRKLQERGVQFTGLIAGDGDQKGWLKTFIAKHRLTQVKMLGAVSSERVREILATSDVFFLPSESEGIALALFEAMSMGVVPVAAKVGGQAELVTDDCGILIEPGPSEVVKYAAALERLLTDHEFRVSMAARSRERICNHFTLDAMGKRMAELLESAATNSRFDPATARAPVIEESNENPMGLPATAMLLLSPRNIGLKLRNLSLLARIMLDPKKRSQLSESFDSKYYLSHHADLTRRGVSPLIHYAVQGYLEERLPSRFFDATGGQRSSPEIAVNPLLWSIVHPQR